jgi:hypothetical protein
MKNKWLIIAVLFPVVSFSQENSSRPRFHTIASVGVAAGESTAKPLFQLVPGFSYDRWFTGIGIGLDQYNFTTIPLFADWRVNFGKTRSGFLYANGGYNFSVNNKSGIDNWFKTTDRFEGGLYMDAGLGYRIRMGPLHRLLFSAGYSQKNITNIVGYTYQCFNPPCTEEVYRYHYNLGRIVTKLSWEIGR